jgi:membrane associated rhomboid family serine protease
MIALAPRASIPCSYPMVSLQPITLLLILANVGIFFILLQHAPEQQMIMTYALWPVGSGLLEPWQLASYGFLHTSATHLAFNMLALFMFGAEVEHTLGAPRYLVYYFGCVLMAAAAQLAMTMLHASQAGYTVGASGGVFGLLLAFGMLFPKRKLMLLILPIPIPAWLFVTLYGAVELWLGVTQTQEGVAHFAHLGGMLGGWLLLQSWLPRRKARPRD